MAHYDLDKIRAEWPISRYLHEQTQVDKVGVTRADCPFPYCKGTSLSFSFSEDRWICHRCHHNGDVIELHMQLTGSDFRSACEYLSGGLTEPTPRNAPGSVKPRPVTDQRKQALRRLEQWYEEQCCESLLAYCKEVLDACGNLQDKEIDFQNFLMLEELASMDLENELDTAYFAYAEQKFSLTHDPETCNCSVHQSLRNLERRKKREGGS